MFAGYIVIYEVPLGVLTPQPVELHVHCLCYYWMDIVCYNWVYSRVVGMHWGPRLWNPHFEESYFCGTASRELIYIASIYTSSANIITALIIWAMFNTVPVLLGFHRSQIRINSLLPRFLYWFCWVTMYQYGMPIPCHLHGTWLSHLGVMPHNLGDFYFFHCCVCWICMLQCDGTECYQHCAIHRSSIIQECSCHFMDKHFWICSTSAPHLLVIYNAAMCHSFVV